MMTKVNKLVPWVAIVALVLLLIGAVKSCFNPPADPILGVVNLSDSVTYWKDAAGREHARAVIAENSVAELRGNERTAHLLDSVLRTLNIQAKQLQSITALSMEARGRVAVRIDTIPPSGGNPAYAYSGTDGYLTFDADTRRGAFLNYTYADSIIMAGYYKRRPLFRGGLAGKKDLYIDAYSMNKNARIKAATALQVRRDYFDRLQLDAYGELMIAPGQARPAAGLSLRYFATPRISFEAFDQYNISRLGFTNYYGGRLRYTIIKL
jgi:hypothetical protein